MRSMTLAILSAALVAAGPAVAKTKAQPEAKQQSAGKPTEKKVCKLLDTSGSRMAERVCMTAADWKKVEAQK